MHARNVAWDRVFSRLHECPLEPLPFPHVVLSPFLPVDLYADFVASLPPREAYLSGNGAFGEANRPLSRTLRLNSLDHCPETIARTIRDDLDEVLGMFASESWIRAIAEKFSVSDVDAYSRAYLHKDLDGYEISPHSDMFCKRITYMLYLPRDERDRVNGTYLLSSRQRHVQSDAHYPWDEFRVEKLIPFLPNTLVAFAPSDISFHAVKVAEEPGSTSGERDIIRGFVFDGRASFIPQCYHPVPASLTRI